MSQPNQRPTASTPRPAGSHFQVLQAASRVMLGWSALFCAVGSAVVGLLGFVLDGRPGGFGALSASVLVLAFFVLGHVIELLTLNRADGFGLAGQVISFVVRIVLFAVVLWLLARTALPDGTFDRLWMGLGALVALIGWQIGMVLGHSRAKIPTIMSEQP